MTGGHRFAILGRRRFTTNQTVPGSSPPPFWLEHCAAFLVETDLLFNFLTWSDPDWMDSGRHHSIVSGDIPNFSSICEMTSSQKLQVEVIACVTKWARC